MGEEMVAFGKCITMAMFVTNTRGVARQHAPGVA